MTFVPKNYIINNVRLKYIFCIMLLLELCFKQK